jgi:PleD family two-component response regulator
VGTCLPPAIEGKGAAFHVVLPLIDHEIKIENVGCEGPINRRLWKQRKKPSVFWSSTMKKTCATCCKAMLSRYGYAVSTAKDGAEGLAQITSQTFDFILCDVKMPQMDGMEFLKAGRDHLLATTVIMMSAYGSIDLRHRRHETRCLRFCIQAF